MHQACWVTGMCDPGGVYEAKSSCSWSTEIGIEESDDDGMTVVWRRCMARDDGAEVRESASQLGGLTDPLVELSKFIVRVSKAHTE